MNNDSDLRQWFLCGFNDALDGYSAPSEYIPHAVGVTAWQAGWDHWQKLVMDEQKRLKEAVTTGDGFPDCF